MDHKTFYEDLWDKEIDTRIAGDYDSYKTRHIGKDKMTLIEGFLDKVPERGSILEVGCGSGRVLAYFKEKYGFKKAYGFDLSEKALSVGRANHPDIDFRSVNIDQSGLPFAEHEIDLTILCDIVEHVEDYDHLWRECIRVSKHVAMKVPLEGTLSELIRTFIGRGTAYNRKHVKGHLHPFTLGFFRRYFARLEKELGVQAELRHANGMALVWNKKIVTRISDSLRGTSINRFIFPTDLGAYVRTGYRE